MVAFSGIKYLNIKVKSQSSFHKRIYIVLTFKVQCNYWEGMEADSWHKTEKKKIIGGFQNTFPNFISGSSSQCSKAEKMSSQIRLNYRRESLD